MVERNSKATSSYFSLQKRGFQKLKSYGQPALATFVHPLKFLKLMLTQEFDQLTERYLTEILSHENITNLNFLLCPNAKIISKRSLTFFAKSTLNRSIEKSFCPSKVRRRFI
jgi:hypothetical protein